MKAFLLAAGLGTRLSPLTKTVPKCLIPINNKPLLFYWLDLLEKENIDEVLINTHYYPNKVKDAIMQRNNKIKIQLFYEEILLGTAGTISANKDFINEEKDFYIIYADNLSNVSLLKLYEFHKSVPSVFTTYVYKTDAPKEKGIFLIDDKTGKALEFEEKPTHPKSNLANAGIGILNKKIFDYFDNSNQDFGKEIMPKIINEIYILRTDSYIRDIGTTKDYKEAQIEWKNIITN